MDFAERLTASLYASIIGDTLCVPVEHTTRQELALCAVKNMLGYGRYDQPKGTWSDDSSMILCTMESLQRGYDIQDLGKTFCSWLFDSRWTASGYVFDSGLTTFLALESIRSDSRSARESGLATEDDNGNGSLMRILPVALYFAKDKPDILLDRVHESSAITHAHPRALVGCGIYSLLIQAIIATKDKSKAFHTAMQQALAYYEPNPKFCAELKHFSRVLSGEVADLGRDSIESSGYIVHTLEAAIWCLLQHDTTKDILLEAVNLGLDTDTTGTVAGGLAGLCYGIGDIPKDWLDTLVHKNDIDQVISGFVAAVMSRPAE
jgi:ADP-ribosyl-[dinitrogen reductase] hydrolase